MSEDTKLHGDTGVISPRRRRKALGMGISTVIMNKRGNPCPKCLLFCGKVLIDDVWSGGRSDGVDPETEKKYPTMSYAISKGLYHPRCKDSHTTYFPGISTADDKWTKKELEDIEIQAKQEARQQYVERQVKKFGRLAKYSLDEENQRLYEARKDVWEETIEQKRERQLEDLEKQFADMIEGYSYDDFIRDFGSVEEGFEGAEKEEIEKAKEIADKIKELRGDIKSERTIRTKEESIHSLKMIGIDFKDNSVSGISGETADKYADLITNFEQSHAGYFAKNKSQIKTIAVVNKIKGEQDYATGMYRSKTKTIEIKYSGIKSKQNTTLSRSDDFELHGLAHEYGHYIADNLEENLGVTEGDIVQRSINKYFNGEMFKSPKDLKDCLSAYGSTSYDEAFAEAFAEAYTCNEPGEFAKIFKAELESALNTGVVKSKDSGIITSGARIVDPDSDAGVKFAECITARFGVFQLT